jgi:hypothetical protein
MNTQIPTREQMLDSMGRPITQSLFLEIGYPDCAVYTLKDQDHEYNGKAFLSLKRLYLACSDPTEYEFATTYLLGWKHWLRLCENKAVRAHIDEWRVELEVKLRSQGVKAAMAQANSGNYAAAKWMADRGWDTRGKGRPSKDEIEHEKRVQAGMANEYEADIIRLRPKAV